MRDHHRVAIEKLASVYESDPTVLALIVGGSVAKGWAEENSDIDFLLVVEDDVYRDAFDAGKLSAHRTDVTDYEGGYADGKIAPLSFLKLVAKKGSEPARAAFLGSIVPFDRTGKVKPLLSEILSYPVADIEERTRRFHSQLMIWSWYVGEAAKRQDPYLMAKAVSEVSLFAMRIVLAKNRRFYPYHKWVTRMVQECPDKPEGIIEAIHAMLATPSVESTKAVVDLLHSWLPLEVDYREHCHHFLLDSEWNWIDHPAPIGDL